MEDLLHCHSVCFSCTSTSLFRTVQV